MSFAAKYPEWIKALVIEDMDVRTRSMSMNPFQSSNRDKTVSFDRCLGNMSQRDVIQCFEREGYPESSVQKWLTEGRVELTHDGSYYSQVNPAFRLLCYEQFFITSHGEDTWKKLVEESIVYNIPIHVMVADEEHTVCDEESLEFMKDTIMVMEEEKEKKKKGGKSMVLHRYQGATHSIHNSAQEDFMADLVKIITMVSM